MLKYPKQRVQVAAKGKKTMTERADEQTVLVTGASGYIAGHCILQLLQQGYRVRGTLRTPSRAGALRQALLPHVDPGDRLTLVTADLLTDDGWAEAAAGCDAVLHVASPNEEKEPDDELAWIAPARDGTLRVLQAAADAGARRVVMTSSIAAVWPGNDPRGRVFSEADWANTAVKIGAYARSKTEAERAAWAFLEELPPASGLELAVINPGYVVGPMLDDRVPTSAAVVSKLLYAEVPGCFDIGFNLVDVRDVAGAHLLAMTHPDAAGKRFICSSGYLTSQEVALALNEAFGERGYRVPTRMLPNIVLRLAGLFDSTVRRALPELGREVVLSTELLRETLDWQPRPPEEAVIAMAESLVALDA